MFPYLTPSVPQVTNMLSHATFGQYSSRYESYTEVSKPIFYRSANGYADWSGAILSVYEILLGAERVHFTGTKYVNVLRNINDRKFISCLGGTLQILPYDDQVTFLRDLSDVMTGTINNDRVITT